MRFEYKSKLVKGITPYTAGEQLNDKKYVKLNTNENPYAPSEKVAEAIKNFDVDDLKLYPNANADTLRKAIATKENVEIENVFCGNGSDEVLALCYPAFFDKDGDGVCYGDISYSFYPVFADFFQIPKIEISVKDNFELDLDKMFSTKSQGVLIANPNAPTSIGIELEVLEKYIKANQNKIIIVDEAYMDFFKQSAVKLTKIYKNLLIVKTFSKSYSLAGIRCGYAIGDKELINALFCVKDCFNSYPIDRLCQKICSVAISDSEYYDKINNKIIKERERVSNELKNLDFIVLPSKANFIFAKSDKKSGRYIYESLKDKGVLVRHFNKAKISDYCRISIGTAEQNDILLKTLKEIL